MIEQPTVELEEEEGDDAEPELAGASFFHLHDATVHPIDDVLEADERACDRVWAMFARKSNDDGFDCRSRNQKVASAWLAQQRAAGKADVIKGFWPKPPPKGESTMSAKRGEFRVTLTEAHAAFVKRHGRVPKAAELFEVLGEEAGTSVENVRMGCKRYELELERVSRADAARKAVAVREANRGKALPPAAPAKPASAPKAPAARAPWSAPNSTPTEVAGASLLEMVRLRLAAAEREAEACRVFLVAFGVTP